MRDDTRGPLELVIRPSVAVPGEVVALSLERDEAGYSSGPYGATLLAEAADGSWEPLYCLYIGRADSEPRYEKLPVAQPSGPIAMHAVAISGSVTVRVPPLGPGTYRLERQYFHAAPDFHHRLAVGYLTVAGGVLVRSRRWLSGNSRPRR